MRVGAVLLAVVAAAVGASPALACTEPQPPPPAPKLSAGASEADVKANARAWLEAHDALRSELYRDGTLKGQTMAFDRAHSLVLVRLVGIGRTSGDPAGQNSMPMVILKPLRWVRGAGAMDAFELAITGITSCGPTIARDAWAGKPGDVLLVYLAGDTLRRRDVLEAISLDNIVEPRTIDALTKGPE